jgi:hypothetical protein
MRLRAPLLFSTALRREGYLIPFLKRGASDECHESCLTHESCLLHLSVSDTGVPLMRAPSPPFQTDVSLLRDIVSRLRDILSFVSPPPPRQRAAPPAGRPPCWEEEEEEKDEEESNC